MAKKRAKNYEEAHRRNIDKYIRQINAIYQSAILEASFMGTSVIGQVDTTKPFSFNDYPAAKSRINELIDKINRDMTVTIVNGSKSEWTLANNKNNYLSQVVFGDNIGKLTQAQYRQYFSNNDKALEAFLKRKSDGMNLSDRVWKYSKQFREEIELGLDLGIRNGLSAQEIARDLKQYLKEPDKLFRRVRDEHGQLHLSKQAKAYHPGQGVHRSSHKNAVRLARTETNMAYRAADHDRWMQADYVVGFEVRRSERPFDCPVCDALKGKYPKVFKFVGWHPNCRCYAISILKTPEEMDADTQKILSGEATNNQSVNKVNDVPDSFKEWVGENSDRIQKAEERGTLPYFLRDNKFVLKNLAIEVPIFVNLKEKDFIDVSTQMNRELGLKAVRQLINSDTGYVGSNNSFKINACLRGDKVGMRDFGAKLSEFDKKTVKILDGVINSNELKDNIVCWRWVDEYFIQAKLEQNLLDKPIDELFAHVETLVGINIRDNAFLSVSGVRSSTLFNDKPILIQIDVLKGTNAYFTTNIQESEIILKRNQSLVIKRVAKDGDKIVMYCEAWVKP